jgi:radical SAM superfamily enzyme YgiQ (UPF0313 family)
LCWKTSSSERPLDGGFGAVNLGLSSIAAVLNARGHEAASLVLGTAYRRENRSILERKIKEFAPDIVGISALFKTFPYAVECAARIKAILPEVKLIIGGPYATLAPRNAFNTAFDAVCTGEGEYPMAEYADAVDAGAEARSIANLWLRDGGGRWEHTPNRPFIEDLDSLPLPDYGMWQDYVREDWRNVPHEQYVMLIGRGCPFLCSFCSNHALRKISSGKYVRLRSPESIVEEVAAITTSHPDVKRVYFEIETIGVSIDWLLSLSSRLEEFNRRLPAPVSFSTNYRIVPGRNHEMMFAAMKKAGFYRLNIGLESGS